jgi:hypothetical protein
MWFILSHSIHLNSEATVCQDSQKRSQTQSGYLSAASQEHYNYMKICKWDMQEYAAFYFQLALRSIEVYDQPVHILFSVNVFTVVQGNVNSMWQGGDILDFKISPCCERCILSFLWFPGIWILCADISEHSVSST